VVEQLSGRWQIKHPDMKPLAERARRAFPANGVTFTWVPRSQNKHADKLANQALDAAARGEVWQSKTPLAGSRGGAGGGKGGDSAGDGGPTAGSGASGSGASGSGASGSGASGSGAYSAMQTDLFEAVASLPVAGWSADVGTPTRLLLLRHGVTALTGEKRFSGLGDPELIADGLEQAHAADVIVASPLRRTRQTAFAVADAAGLEPRLEEGFRELDFGDFEGLTFAEVRERYPEELTAFLSSTKMPAPGGESVEQVAARVAVARDRMLARFPRKTVLIVTHVTPIKVLLCQALGAPLEAVHRMELTAASLSVIDYYADGVANVRCVNDTGHLAA
jgi:probable phosphoglycerate mutase